MAEKNQPAAATVVREHANEQAAHRDAAHQHHDPQDVIREFKAHVNMTAGQLEKWLETEDSQRVGWKGADGHDESAESVGHQSGRRIVELLHKKKADYAEADLAHMKKVNSYVARHLAQRPDGDVSHTNWRYSLMNWGHDPLKDKAQN